MKRCLSIAQRTFDRRASPGHDDIVSVPPQGDVADSTSAVPPQGRIGGGEGVEGLYGSISRTGMARVLAAMAAHCDLGRSSCLVDVGAGLGR